MSLIASKIKLSGSINILAGNYISFGPNIMENGYGLRDNNGVIEFKNNNNNW
jgi:hypothetical protein